MTRSPLVLAVLCVALAACGDDRRRPTPIDAGRGMDAGGDDAAVADAGPGVDAGAPSDGSTGLDGPIASDGGSGCEGGGPRCDGECVDVESDVRHCGACGVACASGQLCFHGACLGDCSAGTMLRVLCTLTRCVDPSFDPDNCGACGNVCGAGEACVAGACTTDCPGPDEVACDRFCRDLTTSVGHCGGCGIRCPVFGGIGTIADCTASTCGYRCATDWGDCDGIAANGCETDLTLTDAHCGACGNACLATELCARSTCVTPRRVFVTDGTHNGNLAGAAGASMMCRDAAILAGLGGTWQAWVCPGVSSMSRSSEPYVRLDRVKVADDWDDLTDGTLDATISVTESGATVASGSRAWTGCLADGTQPSTGANDCLDWTTGSSSTFGRNGVITRTDSYWSWDDGSIAGIVGCDRGFRLYCIEQ